MRVIVALTMAFVFFANPYSLFSAEKDTVAPPAADGSDAVKAFNSVYVMTDDDKKNHFFPSGWMGDTQDLKCSTAYIDDRDDLGKTCMRVTYLAKGKKTWAGIIWQNPPNNWGNLKGGYNLRGAKQVSFWARGEKGGERGLRQ